jgi:hypothetical protein
MRKTIFVCCLFSLIFPICMIVNNFLFNWESLGLGIFWIYIGNHFLLIPLIIIANAKSHDKFYLLPLITWLILLINIGVYMLQQPFTRNSFEQQYMLICLELSLSTVIIVFVYIYLNRLNRNEKA